MSEQRHVTMIEQVTIAKPGSGRITYSSGALQLVDAALAQLWIDEGKAASWPPPPEPIGETVEADPTQGVAESEPVYALADSDLVAEEA